MQPEKLDIADGLLEHGNQVTEAMEKTVERSERRSVSETAMHDLRVRRRQTSGTWTAVSGGRA